MKSRKTGNTYAIKLEKGEKILDSLRNFCAENKVDCGYFCGIGSAEQAELGFYIENKKKYNFELFRQPLEIISLKGNITTMNSEVYVHCHAVFSNANMEAIAGHLKDAIVSATCEIFLVKLDGEIERKYDDNIGLNLMDL